MQKRLAANEDINVRAYLLTFRHFKFNYGDRRHVVIYHVCTVIACVRAAIVSLCGPCHLRNARIADDRWRRVSHYFSNSRRREASSNMQRAFTKHAYLVTVNRFVYLPIYLGFDSVNEAERAWRGARRDDFVGECKIYANTKLN